VKVYHYSGGYIEKYQDIVAKASELFHKDLSSYHVFYQWGDGTYKPKFDYYLSEKEISRTALDKMGMIKRDAPYYLDDAPDTSDEKYRKRECKWSIIMSGVFLSVSALSAYGLGRTCQSISQSLPPLWQGALIIFGFFISIIAMISFICGLGIFLDRKKIIPYFHIATNDGLITNTDTGHQVIDSIRAFRLRRKLKKLAKNDPDYSITFKDKYTVIRHEFSENSNIPYSINEYLSGLSPDWNRNMSKREIYKRAEDKLEVINSEVTTPEESDSKDDIHEVINDIIRKSQKVLPADSPVLRMIRDVLSEGRVEKAELARLEASLAELSNSMNQPDSSEDTFSMPS
jgi:hypothetical protein